MVFHQSLSDSKFPQVSRTLLNNLSVLKNEVVWMVFPRPSTSKSSSPFNNPLITVSKAPITNGIIVNYMFCSFFSSLARSRYLSFFSHFFSFIPWSAKSTIFQILFWSRLNYQFVCQSPIWVYVSCFRTDARLCIYHLFVWSIYYYYYYYYLIITNIKNLLGFNLLMIFCSVAFLGGTHTHTRTHTYIYIYIYIYNFHGHSFISHWH